MLGGGVGAEECPGVEFFHLTDVGAMHVCLVVGAWAVVVFNGRARLRRVFLSLS